jgi:hypothetical protein
LYQCVSANTFFVDDRRAPHGGRECAAVIFHADGGGPLATLDYDLNLTVVLPL